MFRRSVSKLGDLCPKAYKEFCALVLNADNVLLSYQRNALISSICGVGVISYRSQSHLARTTNNGLAQNGSPDRVVDEDKFKPVTGICLIGLGFYFFSLGTWQYFGTLRMLNLTCFVTSSKGRSFLSSDLRHRFIFNGILPSCAYAISIAALFHCQLRQALCSMTPRIVTADDLEGQGKKE